MAIVCVWGLVIMPIVRGVGYLARSPRIARQRTRAIGVTSGLALAAFILLGALPFPHHFRAPGIVEAEQWSEVAAPASGYLREIRQPSGASVHAGDPLVVLENRELELDFQAADADARACRIALDRAVTGRPQEIRALEDHLAALNQRLAYLEQQQRNLTITAPHDGVWAAGELEQLRGSWLHRGMTIGKVLDQRQFEFSAVVPQTEAASLFSQTITRAEVRLAGAEDEALPVGHMRMIPANQEHLPSAAVGWLGGGDIPVASTDPKGLRPQESFFELRGQLQGPPAALRHGCSGKIRFTLPPEPLLRQWERKLRQLFQRQFQD